MSDMDIFKFDMPMSGDTSALSAEWGDHLDGFASAESFEGCTITEAVKAIWHDWSIEGHDDFIGSEDLFIVRGGGLWAMVKVTNCFDDADGSLVTWNEYTPEERREALAAAIASTTVARSVDGLLRQWLTPNRFTRKVGSDAADWALALLDVDCPETLQARVAVAQGFYGPVHEVLAERAQVRKFAQDVLARFDPSAVTDRIMADLYPEGTSGGE